MSGALLGRAGVDFLPFVTVIMPVRNERAHIGRSVAAILLQDYPADRLEVIVVDGTSADGTRDIVANMAIRNPHATIRILDNPGCIVPTGLNVALRVAQGDIIVRVDGHTIIAPDYVRQCVTELQRTGADNVGGKMNASGQGAFGATVTLATSAPFGVGNARFHYSNQEEWVDTVYMGAWSHEVFRRVGLFDEELVRNQDDEFNYRLLKHGGRILLSPYIRSQYTVRGTPSSLWRQYLQYGYWKVRVLQKHPGQMRLRQFAPPLFVAILIGTAALAPFTTIGQILMALIGGAYLVTNLIASLWTARQCGWRHLPLLPFVFAILHVSYGLGFLMGLVRFWNRWGDKVGKTPTWQ